MPVLVHVLDKVLVVNFANIVFGPDEGAVKVQWHVGKGRHTYVGIQFLNGSHDANVPTTKRPINKRPINKRPNHLTSHH